MAQDYSPKIITDNLVLCLDPSHNKSYPFSTLPVKGGLIMWMDAADDSTFSYSSGTTVSQWRDKSGSSYHMVPISAGPTRSAFLNSRKVLAFTTSQQIWNSSINLVTSTYTVFVVNRLTGTTNQRVLTTQYTGATGTNWLLGFWGGYVDSYYAEGWANYSTTVANTSWKIHMGDWSGASTDLANTYSNGTAISTDTNGANAGPLGLGINATEASTCEAAEIIVFNRVLSTQERRLIHTYLGQKWGILNTDRSIIDLSGNGINAEMSNTIFSPYNNGVLNFNGKAVGTNAVSVIKTTTSIIDRNDGQEITVSCWIKPLRTSGQYSVFCANRSNDDSIYNWIFYQHTNDGAISFHGDGQNKSTYIPTINQWINAVNTVTAAGLSTLYINGVSVFSVSGYTYGNGTPSRLGIGADPSSAESFQGSMAQILIYNRALSAAEVAQNYEALKTKFLNTIIESGLVLNLDAGNPSSYSGAGSTWYDVSGNGYDFTLAASGITWNSGGYFSLADGAATRSSSVTSSSTCTIVVWLKTTDTQALLFKGNNNDAYYIAAYYPGQGFYSNNAGSPTYWIDLNSVSNPSSTYLDNRWHMWEIKNVNLSSWTLFEFNKYAGFTFGNGAVGMIMIYNKNLSSAESLRNYNATKGRFGIL